MRAPEFETLPATLLYGLFLLWMSASAQSPAAAETSRVAREERVASRELSQWPALEFSSRVEFFRRDDAAPRSDEAVTRTTLFDVVGPGAIARIAADGAHSSWEVLLDERSVPVPWSALANGAVPLGFSRRCRVELAGEIPTWATLEWRQYPDATSAEVLESGLRTRAFGSNAASAQVRRIPFEIVLSPNDGRDSVRACALEIPARSGPFAAPRAAAIRSLRLSLVGEGASDSQRLAAFARSTVLGLSFDGRETVRLPLEELRALGRTPESAANELAIDWWMPFRHAARLELTTLGNERVAVRGRIEVQDLDWNEGSMYLHGRWRNLADDGHILSVAGRGRIVALSFAAREWKPPTRVDWRVDATTASWPLETFGVSSLEGQRWTRWYGVEAPLFSQGFELGLSGAEFTDVTATSLYYGSPSASDDTPPLDEALHRAATMKTETSVHVPGALECEALEVLTASADLARSVQVLPPNPTGRWSGGEQLFVRATAVGHFVELALPVAAAGRREVWLHATRSWDYGIVQCSLDGVSAGGPLSLFHAEMQTRIGAPRPVSLGLFDLEPPHAILRVEVVGTDPRSRPPHYYLGLDCVVLKEPQR